MWGVACGVYTKYSIMKIQFVSSVLIKSTLSFLFTELPTEEGKYDATATARKLYGAD